MKSLQSPTWPSPRALITAFSGYVAALIALYIAFALDLPNPYWAMVTVFIVQSATPLTGAIWAKAFYRVAGTIIGAAASVLLIPNLVDAPALMILAIGGWIGLCTFGGLLDRSPRSYLFILSGYTVAIVGLPAATHPDAIFTVAVARGEEIIIGVLAPAVVQSILFPRSVALEVSARLDGVMADARAWIATGLRELQPGPTPSHLTAQLTEIDLLATDWRFEGAFSQLRRRALWALEERLITLLPLISAIDDRLAAMRETGGAPAQLGAVASRIATWIETASATSVETNTLIPEEIRTIAPPLGPAATWADILAASLTGRLTELLTVWHECALLAAVVQSPSPRLRALATPLMAGAKPRALHVDRGIALLSGLVAALTVIGALAFSVALRWEEAPVAIVFAAVCCSLFAAADDPTPLAWQLFTGLLAALPLALLYELAILPAIDGFAMLAVVLFPAVMMLGLLLTCRNLSIRGLGAIVAFSTGLALEPRFVLDLAGFLNFYLAMILGPIFALIGMSLARILPARHVIRRILRAGWRELAALASVPSLPGRIGWTSRMLDRVGLLLPRLSSIGTDEDVELGKALRDLRLGVGIVELRRVRAMLDAGAADLPAFNLYDLSLSASYELDLFGRIRRGIEAAQADDEAVRAARDWVRVTVAAEVTGSYLSVCTTGDELAVARRSVYLQQQSLALTRRLQQLGRATSLDVTRSRALVDQLRSNIPSLEARRRNALFRLATLTGRTPAAFDGSLTRCMSAPPIAEPIPVGDGAALLRRRPDVRAAERELAAATAETGVATAELYPRVVLGASIGSTGLVGDILTHKTNDWAAGPLISWELNRSAPRARVAAASAAQRAQLARFDGVVLEALREVETAINVYAHDLQRESSLRKARDEAAQAVADAHLLQTEGRAGALSTLDAERTLAGADAAFAAVRAQVAQDQVALFLALGGGWEKPHDSH